MLTVPTDYNPPTPNALDFDDLDAVGTFVLWVHLTSPNAASACAYIVLEGTLIEVVDVDRDDPAHVRISLGEIAMGIPGRSMCALVNLPGIPLMVWNSATPDNYKRYD